MKKTQQPIKPRRLELKTETVVPLTDDQLRQVAGADASLRLSQCPTKCFTRGGSP